MCSQKMPAAYRERATPFELPTPPESHGGSPVQIQDIIPEPVEDDSGNRIVSISTTFHPTADILPMRPDTIVLSSDGVFFYVHASVMLATSTNNWDGRMPSGGSRSRASEPCTSEGSKVVPCPEPAPVLNVVLHVVYGLSCESYKPTIDVLSAAVDAMVAYGIPPKDHIAPSTPLYALILAQAPTKPIAAYVLAASHDLYSLAVPVSSHLLSFPLPSLTDELTEKIGPLYLKRLFFLHLGRKEALRQLISAPPHPHPPTQECDFTEQKSLTRAWTLASAYLAWDMRPDLMGSEIEATFLPLGERLSCDLCKQSLVERVKHIVVQWSMVKRSI
ncbi:hypothetical protein K466DRAFT_585880 [Polyporus arcularius HHB13444]|uniref:BTB domain-containing protein n=1 Tax=Polyporus arcularius HHB13444 TaxID=1314778 RepID=A0A5C3PFJ6_9APHY|nr:hypothetical protein K466DRAFT_585880 [Polyporus arcularius HHB13444]